jgi:hypothetical protein
MAKATVDISSFDEMTEETIRGTAEAARGAAEVSSEMQREAMHRSAEGAAELGRALVDLVQEQTRHNLEIWTALAGAVDWERVTTAVDWERFYRIQHEHLRASLERSAELARRYLEVGQAVLTTAVDATRDQARRAA